MGGSIGPGFGQRGYMSSEAFYGGEQTPKPKFAPGAGGRPAVPAVPILPRNLYAEQAWERQRLLGAMDQPNLGFPKYIVKV